MNASKSLVTLLLLVVAASAAWAHHASVGIDRTTTVSVEGVVREFRWANPHSWIELEVVNEDGVTELWNFEMFPPSYLIRAGWTRSSLKTGDRVTVEANGFANGDPGGLFVGVTLPDGTMLGQFGGRGGGGRGGRGN